MKQRKSQNYDESGFYIDILQIWNFCFRCGVKGTETRSHARYGKGTPLKTSAYFKHNTNTTINLFVTSIIKRSSVCIYADVKISTKEYEIRVSSPSIGSLARSG